MPDPAPIRGHYWERHNDGKGRWQRESWPPGADLAALRRGVGREAGTTPELWPFYTTLTRSGQLTGQLRAEHIALTLFGVHQQSQNKPMHVVEAKLGVAVRTLHTGTDDDKGKFSQGAVDRRFNAAATATSLSELALHLRGLVNQLNSIGQPIDYTQLFGDLVAWQIPGRANSIRRRWGGQYFVRFADPANQPTTASA